MGRTIFAEETIEKQVQGLFGLQKLQLGLLIGQFTDTRDYIVHIAQAPDPVENEAEIENNEGDMLLQGDPTNERKIFKQESSTKPKESIGEDFDENWIIEHARQVNRMLPGGLSVMGIYIFSSPDFMNKNQTRLRHCLHKVHKQLEKGKFLKAALPHSDRILIHICSASRKITCRTLDVQDSQSSFRPGEFKYQSFMQKWHTLRCVANVQVKVFVPLSSEKSRYETQIQLSLHDDLDKIWKSVAVIDKEIIDESEYLFSPGKGTKKVKEEPKVFDVELFSPCISNREGITKDKVIGILTLGGNMASRGYVYNKATKGMAAKAIKMDIIRSIQSRVELLCEEAEVNDLYQVNNWSLISPTRIFAPLRKTPIQFCDYAFKDEKPKDSLERFTELLNLDLTEEDLICKETSPAEHTSASGSDETDTRSQASAESVEVSDKRPELSRSIGWIIAIVMVFFAILITMVLPR